MNIKEINNSKQSRVQPTNFLDTTLSFGDHMDIDKKELEKNMWEAYRKYGPKLFQWIMKMAEVEEEQEKKGSLLVGNIVR